MNNTNVRNGRLYGENECKTLNAHISYKERSVIIDYEFCLHIYQKAITESKEYVPFEVYPYSGDIYVGYVPLDKDFGKADIGELIKIIDEALENEPPVLTEEDFEN